MKAGLNLGCGGRPVRSMYNHDREYHSDYVDVAFDLEVFPWPVIYADPAGLLLEPSIDSVRIEGRLGEVVARDVLEHIAPNLFYRFIDSVWDLLSPGGVFSIQVPKSGSKYALIDPTHWRGFELQSFDYLDPSTQIGRKNFWCTRKKWRVEHKSVVPRSNTNLTFVLRKIDESN